MTLVQDSALARWTIHPATPLHHPQIADFLATTAGIAGRKFAADSRDIAEQLAGAFPDAVHLMLDKSGRVRGYAVLHRPHGLEPEVVAEFLFDPAAPARVLGDVVAGTVERFRAEAASIPGAYLRTFIGTDQQSAIDALIGHGARQEGQFIRTRKDLSGEDTEELEALRIDGLALLSWPEVIERGLLEQVRQLQFDTFQEHFGNMSKTPEIFAQHIESRSFTPDFSIAVVDGGGAAVGYVLGSTYTYINQGVEERSAHTDYIGVRRDLRRHGIAEFLLRKVWSAALRRGLSLASLGTDIHNRSNAHVLYERLGYRAVEHQFAYRIDAPTGTE
ncbi:GNAT family N-acetyltransferase [Mycobacterium sp. AMU20-3851]|uniref:GNAT family N-acetyltransferase n=1 Tax=Mycobacterium sp. AMU20-3851 TaxID=3122055 RepID=UPI0037542CEE